MTTARIVMRDMPGKPPGANIVDCATGPCCAVMALGLGGVNASVFHSQYHLEIDHDQEARVPDPTIAYPGKPPYRVPLLADVRQVPWNGLNVVTTFAGAGGSSTGYRMAGCRILYAVEFIPAAQDSYRANKAPYTYLDGRDVREVTGQEILRRTGLKRGQLDIFDGSPPCEPFSSAGQRDKKWGQVNKYSEKEQRSDDLFFEYARLLEELQPKAFVAENVAGLVRGRAIGYFKQIHRRLQDAGYKIEARLLDAQWLGVPQTRQRLIFVGLRSDLAAAGRGPLFPEPLPYRYSVRDALPHIFDPGGFDEVTVGNDAFEPEFGPPDVPSPTIMAGGARTSGEVRCSGRIVSPRAGTGFTERDNDPDMPLPAILANGKDGGPMPLVEDAAGPRVRHEVDHGSATADQGDVTDRPSPTVLARRQQCEELTVEGDGDGTDAGAELGARFTHDTGGHNQTRGDADRKDEPSPTIVGDGRAATHYMVEGPRVEHDPKAGSGSMRHAQGDVTDRPSPAILATTAQKNEINVIGETVRGQQPTETAEDELARCGCPLDSVDDGGFCACCQAHVDDEDMYAQQGSPDAHALDGCPRRRRLVAGSFQNFHDKKDVTDQPSPALLTGQPLHYLVENDGADAVRRDDQGVQRRKLTIPELKALSSFPPDYTLTGSYSQQWERCGDCVPPLMMRAIALKVLEMIDGLPASKRRRVDTLNRKKTR